MLLEIFNVCRMGIKLMILCNLCEILIVYFWGLLLEYRNCDLILIVND